MDNPDTPHTDVVSALLLRALLASSDIDEAHGAASSIMDLKRRWAAVHEGPEAKHYKLRTAQRKKLAAWFRIGLVDDIIFELEALKPQAELQPLPCESSVTSNMDIQWWTLFSMLYQLTHAGSLNSDDPTISATMLDPTVVGSIVERLITLFLGFKHFASPVPLTEESRAVVHFVESHRYQSLRIISCLLNPQPPPPIPLMVFSFSPQIYELLIKFAILNQHHLLPPGNSAGEDFFQIESAPKLLEPSFALLRLAVLAARGRAQNSGIRPERIRVLVTRITGIPPMKLIGDTLYLADACGGTIQIDGYCAAATMITNEPSKLMISAAHEHQYLRRSLTVFKEHQFPSRGTSNYLPESTPLLILGHSWAVCLNRSSEPAHRIAFLSESVHGGILFLLERASLLHWEFGDRLQELINGTLTSLVGRSHHLVPEIRPLREKLLRQSVVIHGRMYQNENVPLPIRKRWADFVHREARAQAVEIPEGPFCSNYGCETLEVVSQQCARCKTQLYCSKECQTSDWKRFHKLQCATSTRTNMDLAGTS